MVRNHERGRVLGHPPGAVRRRAAAAARGALLLLLAAATLAACEAGTPTPAPSGAPAGPTAPPNLAAGQQVFMRYCNQCHPGGNQGVGPSLRNAGESDTRIAVRVRRGGGPMPAFDTGTISDSQLQDLIAYVHSLR